MSACLTASESWRLALQMQSLTARGLGDSALLGRASQVEGKERQGG